MTKNIFLGIDTSQTEASLCLASFDKVLCSFSFSSQKQQLEKLVPTLQWMLSSIGRTQEELAAVGVTTGGGSFTGLRLGMSTAKALAYALQIPIVGVPTLDSYVYSTASYPGYYMPLLDVRKHQVYGSVYQVLAPVCVHRTGRCDGTFPFAFKKCTEDFTCRVADVEAQLPSASRNEHVVVFGSALDTYEKELRAMLSRGIFVKQHGGVLARAVALYTRKKFMQKEIKDDVFSISLTYTHTP